MKNSSNRCACGGLRHKHDVEEIERLRTALTSIADHFLERGQGADGYWTPVACMYRANATKALAVTPHEPGACAPLSPLAHAKDAAEKNFHEWNDVTGLFQRGVSYYGEMLSVIEDAVEIGYRAGSGPFDCAAILGAPRERRISMSFQTQEQYEAALVFLDMADAPEKSPPALPHCPSCLCGLGTCKDHPAAVFHPPATCPECASGEPAYALLEAVKPHTTEDDFQHFMAYSNLKVDEAALRWAFYAGKDEPPPGKSNVHPGPDCSCIECRQYAQRTGEQPTGD